MRARSTFNAKQITNAIQIGVEMGLRAIVLTLGAEVQRKLSMPGRGRVYVRKKGGGFGKHITRGQLAAVLLARRESGKKHRTLRALGYHKASAPGDPPAIDTGTLRRSWQVGFRQPSRTRSPSRQLMRVGSNVKYAPWMEFGTRAIKPRPYLRPSVVTVQKLAQSIMDRHVAAALAKLGARR